MAWNRTRAATWANPDDHDTRNVARGIISWAAKINHAKKKSHGLYRVVARACRQLSARMLYGRDEEKNPPMAIPMSTTRKISAISIGGDVILWSYHRQPDQSMQFPN